MKNYVKSLGITLTALVLAACGSASSSATPLTSIMIGGATDIEVAFDSDFNFFTGVTATGNDTEDYTSSLTLTSTSDAINTANGELDTTQTGIHTVRYRVEVGTIVATKFRNVTVEQPESTGMLINPDFSIGTAGWDDPSVVFNADGSALTLSTEEGALKAVVTAGANAYTPRFGQMNVPFELDTTYEVSFRAKSSVSKAINLNVGELLTSAPWFVDFKPNQPETRTITTSWETYNYTFTHRLDNPRGGILFELGKVSGQQVNGTVWFDDIAIEESTAGPDVTAPILSGVQETVSVLVGSTYDPLSGVSAVDAVDGTLTDDIIVEVLDGDDVVVDEVDTTAPGVFTVNYSVEDAAGNEATDATIVNVQNLEFMDENLLANGDFSTEIGSEWDFYQLTEADTWAPNPKPIVVRTQDILEGTYSLDITNGGGLIWAIQFFQEGIELVEGTTYRFSINGSASIARKISVGIGYSFGDNEWNEYGRKNGIELDTSSSTQDFIFTVTKASAEVKIVFELGTQEGFSDGIITFDQVRLQRLDEDPLIVDPNFNMSDIDGGHSFFTENGGSMSRGEEGGALLDIPELGGAAYQPHYFYLFPTLAPGNYEVKIVLTSSVTRDLRFNVILPDAGYASILPDSFVDFEVTAETEYTFKVSFEVTNPLTNVKLELDFGTLGGDLTSLPGTFLLSQVLVYRNFNS